MPLKHGTSAALERRMDLASFFCMIGRHGPAVVLAVLAVLCLLAGLVVYWRMKRGRKRREATAAAGDGRAAAAAVETDASGQKRPGLRARGGGPKRLSPPVATDASEDGLSQIKEDPLHQNVTLRLRHVTASEKNPALDSAKSDFQERAIRATEEVRDWTTEAENEEEPVGDTMEEAPGDEREEPEPIQGEACATGGTALEDEDLQTTEDYDAKEEEEELVPQEDQMDPSAPEEPRAWTGSPQLDQGTALCLKRLEGVVLPKEFDLANPEVPSVHETAELHCSSPVPRPTLPDQGVYPASVDPSPEFPTHEDSVELDCQQPMSEEIQVPGSLPEDEEEEPPASAPDELSEKPVDIDVMTQNVHMEMNDHEVIDPTVAENQESVEDCRDLRNQDSAKTITNEEVTCPDLMLAHDRPDQMDKVTKEFDGLGLIICSCKNNNVILMSKETSDSAPHLGTQNTTQQIRLPRFSLQDADLSPGFGAESGISSMTVTPDLQEEDFSKMVENMDCDPQCEEAELRLYADDIATSFFHGESAELSFGPPGPHGEAVCHFLVANEDVFGRDIEEKYQRELEAAMLEIKVNMTSIEAVAIKRRKTEKEEEEEKEEAYEKTEISIMEATMDHNEWITAGDYQALPWMSGSSFSQDRWRPPTDVSSVDTDSAPFGDVTGTPPPGDDVNKRVVAVPPMPQTVSVTFRIHYLTHSPQQTLAITGSRPELGSWAEFIPLERAGGGHWAAVVSLPAESHVEWKFVMLEKGQVSRWEECGNRALDTGYGDQLTVHKWWGLL